MPKILKMPKRDEHRNGNSPSERTRRPSSSANIIDFELNCDEEAAFAAKIANWLKLADTVLGGDRARKRA